MQAQGEKKTKKVWMVVSTSSMLEPAKVTVRFSAPTDKQVCKKITAAAPVARTALVLALSQTCCRRRLFSLGDDDLLGGVQFEQKLSSCFLAIATESCCFCLVRAPKDLNKR
jgi:hypothetical protein